MRPDVASVDIVRRALERGRRRLLLRDLLHALAVGASVVTAALAFASLSPRSVVSVVALTLAAIAGLFTIRRPSRTSRRVAVLIERHDLSLKNLVITAEEIIRHPDRFADWISRRVFDDASSRVRALDLGAIVSLTRATVAATAAVLMAVVLPVALLSGRRAPDARSHSLTSASGRATLAIEARLEPPAYSKRPASVLINPERIDGLDGTRLTVMVPTHSAAARVRFGDRQLSSNERADGTRFEMAMTESGYLAVEVDRGDGGSESTRLIAVNVTPDRAPSVRVERPGHDLLLPTANHVVEIDGDAVDDIGLSALTLRYTKVSGSGEQFEFVEGELPLAVTRESAKNWRARGRIPVGALGLEPGDSLVYRLTARDERPGSAGFASSDTFFVEIVGPGQLPLEGFEMPPEHDRYALSQQMIVVKLRRLRERENRLSPRALGDETGALAAEQRAVRGNVIFLMGGRIEDEEEEAEQSDEIQEGRLENTAAREIWRAVSHMTAVEQALAGRDTGAALTAALKAVEALQRAFTRNRYVLRTLPARLRIDPSRRLSGDLDEVKDGNRAVAPPADAVSALPRQLLAEMIALIPQIRNQPRSPQVATALSQAAEQAMSAAAADSQWSGAVQAIVRLRSAVSESAEPPTIDADARAVVQALIERARQHAAAVRGADWDRLESAWAEEARRR